MDDKRDGPDVSSQQLLLAAASARVAINDASITRVSVAPANADAGYRLHSDGTIDGTSATSLNWAQDLGTWLLLGASGDFETRATLNSGSLNAGSSATGVWLALSTTRAWWGEITADGGGIQDADLTVEIRDAVSLQVLDSAHITIHAEVTL